MRYSIVGTKWRGERAVAVLNELRPGAELMLVRDPLNPHDPRAVAVWSGDVCVGFVPKASNIAVAEFIDQRGETWTPGPGMALDATPQKAVRGTFQMSPNSAYPQVEIAPDRG